MRKCVYRKQLDLETLVATRTPNPLGRLEGRLMCPACGNTGTKSSLQALLIDLRGTSNDRHVFLSPNGQRRIFSRIFDKSVACAMIAAYGEPFTLRR